MAALFEPVMNANCRLLAPPPTWLTAIGGYLKVVSYDMLGEQLHYSKPMKREPHCLWQMRSASSTGNSEAGLISKCSMQNRENFLRSDHKIAATTE